MLEALFALGLERCHVRKPHASADELRAWIEGVRKSWRARLVLHQHHELVEEFGLAGRHFRDEGATIGRKLARASGSFTSRSCHDLETLRDSLGRFDSVFLSPVFASISKPGYGPSAEQPRGEGTPPTAPRSGATNDELRATDPTSAVPVVGGVPPPRSLSGLLCSRTPAERATTVLALGGITVDTAPRALAHGFDGVAVLGAVWQAADPVAAYLKIRDVIHR